MSQQIVTVTVDDNSGAFEVDLTGFQGIGCDAVIKAFAELGETKTVIEKPEYKQKTVTQRSIQSGR